VTFKFCLRGRFSARPRYTSEYETFSYYTQSTYMRCDCPAFTRFPKKLIRPTIQTDGLTLVRITEHDCRQYGTLVTIETAKTVSGRVTRWSIMWSVIAARHSTMKTVVYPSIQDEWRYNTDGGGCFRNDSELEQCTAKLIGIIDVRIRNKNRRRRHFSIYLYYLHTHV